MKTIIILTIIITFFGCKQDELLILPNVTKFDSNNLTFEEELVFDSFIQTKGFLPYTGGNGQVFDTVFTGEILETGLELIIPKSKLKNGDGILEILLKGKPKKWGGSRFEFEIFKHKCYSNIPISLYKQGQAKIEYFPINSATIDNKMTFDFDSFKKGIPLENFNKEVLIPYKKGNGQKYYGITTNSKLLLGLQACTTDGILANGDGFLIVKLKGTPKDTGVAYFDTGFGYYQTQFSIKIKN